MAPLAGGDIAPRMVDRTSSMTAGETERFVVAVIRRVLADVIVGHSGFISTRASTLLEGTKLEQVVAEVLKETIGK